MSEHNRLGDVEAVLTDLLASRALDERANMENRVLGALADVQRLRADEGMSGQRVELQSPYGRVLRAGHGCNLVVENGATGIIQDGRVNFDGLEGVLINVPQHWLRERS